MKDGKPAPKLMAWLRFRSLTPEEEDLWSVVARTVRPLRPRTLDPGSIESATFGSGTLGKRPAPAAGEQAALLPEKSRPVKAVKNGAAGEPQALAPNPRPAGPPSLNPIMRKERQKLVRGRVAIDARIDLHGMTQTEAHAALRNLLQRCQENGAKFVLVITGKGQPNAVFNGRGVLRRQVPQWLALPEFRRYVAGFDVAHTGHGGEGALYVRLRKAKVLR